MTAAETRPSENSEVIDKTETFLVSIKNHRYIFPFAVIAAIVIAIGMLTDAVSSIWQFFNNSIEYIYHNNNDQAERNKTIIPENASKTYAAPQHIERQPSVLVTPIENNTLGTDGAGLRDALEDIVVHLGGRPVERHQLDNILQEIQFGQSSGLVDPNQAAKIGRMVGAKYVLVGSIGKVDREQKKFSGYNINTSTTVVTASIRVRLIDTEAATVVYSKLLTGSRSSLSSKYGSSEGANMTIGALEDALNALRDDKSLQSMLSAR